MSDEEIVRLIIEAYAPSVGTDRVEALSALTRLIAAKEQAEKERDEARSAQGDAEERACAANDASREAAKHVSSISRQLGEMQGKLDVCQMIGVVEGWQHKCAMLTIRLRSMCEALQGAEWVLSQSETYTIGLMVTCRMTQKQIHNSDVLANIRKAASTIRAELDAAKKEIGG